MRAWRVVEHGEPLEVLHLEDVSPPRPSRGQLRIRVGAAALNFADDLLCRGRYQLDPTLPFTPGMEVAGRVVEAAADTRISVGTRVAAIPDLPHGGLAEECVADERNAFAIPDAVDDVDAAAMLIPFQTSHVALHRRGRLARGETLLVHAGAGGVGSAAIQLGVAAGARVIATAGGSDKVALCRELGAELAVDYTQEDFVAAVATHTNGAGADVIYDPVGGEVLERSRRCIAWEGRILVVGFASGAVPALRPNHVLFRNYSVVGVYMGEYSQRERVFLNRVHAELLDLHAAGRIRAVIGETVSLEETPRAIRDLAERRTVGKVVVRVAS